MCRRSGKTRLNYLSHDRAGLLIPFLWKLPTEYNRNVLGSIDKFRSRISEMLAARRKDLEEQKLEVSSTAVIPGSSLIFDCRVDGAICSV